MWELCSEGSFEVGTGAVRLQRGLPAAGAAGLVREVGEVLRCLLGAGVGVEAPEGQNPVALPAVQFIDANPFFFCLWVCEDSLPTQALVDLVRKVLLYFSKVGETSRGGERRGEPVCLSVLSVLLPRAVIFAGT